MSSGMAFDEETSRNIEALYTIPDMGRRRKEIIRIADPKVGESVIDVGIGPGFVTSEIAAIAGPSGHVLGIDSSDVMLSMARRRTQDKPWVEVKKGDATSLPAGENQFDLAIATQVLEYVPVVEGALRELYRVLRPGGRALVLDTDFKTLVWNSSDATFMDRIMNAFDEHCLHPNIGRTLGAELQKTGFRVELTEVFTILDTVLGPGRFSYSTIKLVEKFVPGRRGLTSEDLAKWKKDLEDMNQRGEYFFSLNQYIFLARKD